MSDAGKRLIGAAQEAVEIAETKTLVERTYSENAQTE